MSLPLGRELDAERLRGVYPFGRLRAGPEELEGLAKTSCSMDTYLVSFTLVILDTLAQFRHFITLGDSR
jgi:hypothetical protein